MPLSLSGGSAGHINRSRRRLAIGPPRRQRELSVPLRRRLSAALLSTLLVSGLLGAILAVTAAVVQAKPEKPPVVPPPVAAVVQITLTGLADAAAGTPQTVHVTASRAGRTDPSYRGTVAFASTDPQAVLPANYSFTRQDKGTRTFTVTLKTAGAQGVTVRDVATATLTASQSAAITAAAATRLQLSTDLPGRFEGQPVATAGQAFGLTIRALDSFDNLATGYTGTVELSSTDVGVALPNGDPGSGVGSVAFASADGGQKSIPGLVLRTKRIYAEHATLGAVDPSDAGLADAIDLQVLPGPAVSYAACGAPLTKASGYQVPADTIGVNDEFGVMVVALDAYGNNATNRQPANPLSPAHPMGYVANATVVTSDLQAAGFVTNPPTATITGSRWFIGASLPMALRTAGAQTITITDPDNAALTTTCTFTVEGMRAFRGTVTLSDPFSAAKDRWSSETINHLLPWSHLPPNSTNYTITDLTPPQVSAGDLIDGLVNLGTVAAGPGTQPLIQWDLDPPPAPPPALFIARCGYTEPCPYNSGPRTITFTLVDDWGNRSNGSITFTWFNPAPASGNIGFAASGISISGSDGGIIGFSIPLSGTVLGASGGITTIQFGDSLVNVLAPSDGSLVIGHPVTAVFQDPLVVAGDVLCDATNLLTLILEGHGDISIGCQSGGFAKVSLINQNSVHPNESYMLHTRATGACLFVGYELGEGCPEVNLNLLPPPTGPGMPPLGTVGVAYSYDFRVSSSYKNETVRFETSGTLPPGLSLSPGGRLEGTPTSAGSFVYSVIAVGTTSGVSAMYNFATLVLNP
jgi:hypothetical protein